MKTFNIRFDYDGDGPNRWKYRSRAVCDKLVSYNCDILCLQEALQYQYDDVNRALNMHGHYAAVSRGREEKKVFKANEPNEHCSIFYNTDKFKCINSGFFWLSETPDQPGTKGWDSDCVRIASWVVLDSKQYIGGLCPMLIVNTHWDHLGVTARIESAKLIKRKIIEISNKVPVPLALVVFTGDLNCFFQSQELQEMLKEESDPNTGFDLLFKDTRQSDQKLGTFTGWHDECDIVIDYVLVCDKNNANPKITYQVIDDYLPDERRRTPRTPRTPKTPQTPQTPSSPFLQLPHYNNFAGMRPQTDTGNAGIDDGCPLISIEKPPETQEVRSEKKPRPDAPYHPFPAKKSLSMPVVASFASFEDLEFESDEDENYDDDDELDPEDTENTVLHTKRKISDHRPVLVTIKF
jgi:endonuclease/exonuclease/phosphatase family metal-dependent hydrolase